MSELNHDHLGRRDATCGCCCVVDIAGLERLIDELSEVRVELSRVESSRVRAMRSRARWRARVEAARAEAERFCAEAAIPPDHKENS